MVRVIPQPGPRPEKVFQNFRQALGIAPALQRQELARPGGGLGAAHPPAPCPPGRQPLQQGGVTVPRQKPGGGGILFRPLPSLGENGAGPLCPRRRGRGKALGSGFLLRTMDETGVSLPMAHVLLVP